MQFGPRVPSRSPVDMRDVNSLDMAMDNRTRLPAIAIVAIVIGVTFGVFCILGFLLYCFFRSQRKKATSSNSSEVEENYASSMRTKGVGATTMLSDAALTHHSHANALIVGLFFSWWRSVEEPRVSPKSRITRFSFKELQKATDNWTTILGKGSFGPVYKANLPNGTTIAVKVLAVNSKQGEKEFQNEVMLLGRLHHKNLSNLVGFCAEGDHRLLAYDYMSNGSLSKRLHDEHYEPLCWEQRISTAQDISRGIEYLHDGAVPPVIHRDIKAANILLDNSMTARLADFGLSKEVDPDMPASGIRGTYGYVDPEYVSNNSLTEKSDVYSFGVLLFELIAARSPQQGLLDYVEMVMLGNEGKVRWLEILDTRLNGKCDVQELEEMALIARKCIEKKPSKRPRIREVAQALSRLGQKCVSARIEFRSLSSVHGDFDGIEGGMISRSLSSLEGR